MTRARDVADTQDNVGGSVAPFVAGKNKIINGDFGIWQRGTSGAGTFLADRFQYNSTGSDSYTQSRQTFTPGNAIAGYEPTFFHRMVITTAAAYAQFSTNVENVRTFAGQTVTLSFWAKADTNTRNFGVYFDQNFGSGGSSVVTTNLPMASLTTGWVRYTASVALPSISGKTIGTNDYLTVRLVYSGAGTFDTWGFQLESGNVATPFTTATGNPASELAACQRYYWREYGVAAASTFGSMGIADSTQSAYIPITAPVTMRAQPSITEGNLVRLSDGYSAAYNATGFVGSNYTNQSFLVYVTIGTTSLVVGRAYFLQTQSASGFIGFSAEL